MGAAGDAISNGVPAYPPRNGLDTAENVSLATFYTESKGMRLLNSRCVYCTVAVNLILPVTFL